MLAPIKIAYSPLLQLKCINIGHTIILQAFLKYLLILPTTLKPPISV